MAARLTDRQKKRILADYVQMGSFRAVAKAHKVSPTTVKNIVEADPEFKSKCAQKKRANSEAVLAHMDTQRDKVNRIIDIYLDKLLKIDDFDNLKPNQLTTALGTLIDKWTLTGDGKQDSPLMLALVEATKQDAPPLEYKTGDEI